MASIRIAVIDDHPVFREGVISILKNEPAFEIIGEGGSADDAVRLAGEARPNVMLLDVSMPGGGINALRQITEAKSPTRVVMLTASETGTDVLSAFELGAVGYLLKGVHKSELIDAINSANAGKMVIDPSLAVRIIGRLRSGESSSVAPVQSIENLTPREVQVLDFVSKGLTNKEIAKRLELTPRTVKNYMTSVMAKLNVRNRVEAALLLLKQPR